MSFSKSDSQARMWKKYIQIFCIQELSTAQTVGTLSSRLAAADNQQTRLNHLVMNVHRYGNLKSGHISEQPTQNGVLYISLHASCLQPLTCSVASLRTCQQTGSSGRPNRRGHSPTQRCPCSAGKHPHPPFPPNLPPPVRLQIQGCRQWSDIE